MSTWDVEVKTTGNFEDFEVPPEGAIPARICAMVDVGTHDARKPDGSTYARQTVILGFELGENDSKGNPFHMAKAYTLSLSTKSTLFEIVKALNGEPKLGDKLNPAWIANKPCLLQITHEHKVKNQKERTYANLLSIGKPPKGLATPQGSCVLWRVQDRHHTALPDLKFLPPLWHDASQKMLRVNEWVDACHEVAAASAGDRRMTPAYQAAAKHDPGLPKVNVTTGTQPMTQAEVDDIPF